MIERRTRLESRLVAASLPAALLIQLAACSEPKALPLIYLDAMPTDLGLRGPLDVGTRDAIANGAPDADAPDDGVLDAGILDADFMPGVCPPEAPFGVTVNTALPSAQLVDCDGNPFDLQGMCEKKASWIFSLAGW